MSPSTVHYLNKAIVWLQIASKVELHIGTQSGDTLSWKRLGSFSFDSNDRSKLQARELKSVTISVQALLIRIVLVRCHTNSQNIYKQVFFLPASRFSAFPSVFDGQRASAAHPHSACALQHLQAGTSRYPMCLLHPDAFISRWLHAPGLCLLHHASSGNQLDLDKEDILLPGSGHLLSHFKTEVHWQSGR